MILQLATTQYGDGPPLAILHGLFGSGRNWATIARRLGGWRRVVAFDLRNHAASPWADAMDYPAMAEDVRATLRTLGHERYALLGHSMGGKVAMALALLHPVEVERLVVADIAPVSYPLHHLNLVRAMRSLDLGQLRRRSDADSLLAASVPDAAERNFLLQNLLFDDGRAHWRLNLETIENELPRLGNFPPLANGSAYEGPALFVAGGRSEYVRPEHDAAVHALFPRARIERIDAGHWLHAEQPLKFLALVEPFLRG